MHRTYIKDINSALVHEESLKQSLNKDLPFSEGQDQSTEPRATALPDGQKGDLGQISKEKQDQVDKDRND